MRTGSFLSGESKGGGGFQSLGGRREKYFQEKHKMCPLVDVFLLRRQWRTQEKVSGIQGYGRPRRGFENLQNIS